MSFRKLKTAIEAYWGPFSESKSFVKSDFMLQLKILANKIIGWTCIFAIKFKSMRNSNMYVEIWKPYN